MLNTHRKKTFNIVREEVFVKKEVTSHKSRYGTEGLRGGKMKKTIFIILGILVLFAVWSCNKQAPCEPGVIVVITASYTDTPTFTPTASVTSTPTISPTPTPRTGNFYGDLSPLSYPVTLDYSINGGPTTSLNYPDVATFTTPDFYFYSGDIICVTSVADTSSSAGGLFFLDLEEGGSAIKNWSGTGVIILTVEDCYTVP